MLPGLSIRSMPALGRLVEQVIATKGAVEGVLLLRNGLLLFIVQPQVGVQDVPPPFFTRQSC